MNIPFIKMHGLGNDFVIMKAQDIENVDIVDLVKKVADRHLGVGCDQFIIYTTQEGSIDGITYNYQMWVYNNDSSHASTCGNATRCIAKLIYEETGLKQVNIKVSDRIIFCSYIDDNNISVNMGTPSFHESWMPMQDDLEDFAMRYKMQPKEIVCVSMSNPHIVIFGNFLEEDKEVIGQALQNGDLFPDGVNVNFASKQGNRILLTVWERGAGITLACGSGACATFAAAKRLGFIDHDAEVVFKLGSLYLSSKNNDIIMRGSAIAIARGIFYYG